jgi:hypothetical protein
MALQNKVLLSFAGGEVTSEIYGRLDLPAYQRGWQRIQNYEVLPQGGARYRNGSSHVSNTNGLNDGNLYKFTFSESDTFILELTANTMRFYRNFARVMNTATIAITGVSAANPCVITAPGHGLSNGQEIYITGLVGMPELNNQVFLVSAAATNTFTLQNIFGVNVNSTGFITYISGGIIETPYQISTPWQDADLDYLHFSQSADVIYVTDQNYMPYKIERLGNTNWTVSYFERTQDPFNEQTISSITNANPGVFTTPNAHGFAVGDTVYFDGFVGGSWTSLNQQPRTFTVGSAGFTTTTFSIVQSGTPVNTSAWGTPSTYGDVIDQLMCPQTSAFLNSSRLMYANWGNNPQGLTGSQTPDTTTGATQFDNFTLGANDNDAFIFTIASVFGLQDAIQWITSNNNVVVLGCANTMRIVTGSGGPPNPITPSSIQVSPINNVGGSTVKPYSNGLSVYYVDQTTFKIESFVFDIQVYNYVSVNQTMLANQFNTSSFVTMDQQRREANLLWVQRADGVLLGMTFDEIESVFGWHRHYWGGNSNINGVMFDRAKILAAVVEPRQNADAVLWLLVERQLANGNTYRSVEFWNSFTKWYDLYDFYSGNNWDAVQNDTDAYNNATYEQIKKAVYLDMCTTYDGSQQTASITPSATTGNSITLTANNPFFLASMVGQQIWKAYDAQGNGGGRAQITSITSSTVAVANVVDGGFDTLATIPAGSWYLSAGKVYGMLNFAGETFTIQEDGAPADPQIVAADGSLTLDSQCSVVQAGYQYLGMLASMNCDIGGETGTAQAKIRMFREVCPRFINTNAARIGTNIHNTRPLIFSEQGNVSDRPVPLFDGVYKVEPDDSWTRQDKRIVILQDVPAPQTVLSIDVQMDTADDR